MHRTLRSFFLFGSLGTGGLLLLSSCLADSTATEEDRICTKGANVFCRCEKRKEGTKKCKADERSFEDCVCSEEEDPIFEEDAGVEEVDSGPVDPGKPKIDNGCKGKLGIVAGLTSPPGTSIGADPPESKDLYFAIYDGDGAFKPSKSTGPGLRSPATIVPLFESNRLLAVWRTRGFTTAFSVLSGTTWSAPLSVGGNFAANTEETPALIAYQGKIASLGYRSADDSINYERFYGTDGWLDTETSARPINAGAAGKKGPAIAAIANKIYAAYITAADAIVVEENPWTATPVPVVAANKTRDVQPALVAIDSTNTLKDLLLVYTDEMSRLAYSVRASNSKNWSAPKVIDSLAIPLDSDGVSLAPMVRGRAIAAWRGTNKHGFVSQYDAMTDKWTAPQEVKVSGAAELASQPAVSESRCGNADATVAYALQAGGIALTRFKSGEADGPFELAGLPKVTYVGVGELP